MRAPPYRLARLLTAIVLPAAILAPQAVPIVVELGSPHAEHVHAELGHLEHGLGEHGPEWVETLPEHPRHDAAQLEAPIRVERLPCGLCATSVHGARLVRLERPTASLASASDGTLVVESAPVRVWQPGPRSPRGPPAA